MKTRHFSALALSAALVGCQTITEEAPSTPTGGTNPIVSVPLPLPKPTPKPAATPTPTPIGTPTPTTPTPKPTPTATPEPPGPTGTCVPAPPPLHHINLKVHNDMGFKKIVDAAPNVCNTEYCVFIMKDPARRCCPVRVEGDPDREFCEGVVVGYADTGKPGPTWSLNGKPCLEADPGGTASRCVNHWDNQYLVVLYGSGTMRACSSQTGYCNELIVP